MARITRRDIRIEAGFKLSELTGLHIIAAVNAHGTLSLSGILPQSEAARIKDEKQAERLIRIYIHGVLVFSGNPLTIEIREINDVYTIEAKAISCSWQLELSPQSYFYQHTGQSYQDMLKKATTAGRGSLIATQGKKKIGQPILQYEQDPWNFSLRTAAMIPTVVTPDISADYPQICLGIPDGDSYAAGQTQLVKNIRFFALHKSTGKNAGIVDYMSYGLEDERIFRLGDRVSANGESMPVMELKHIYIDGVLANHYTLGYEANYCPSNSGNPIQTGLMLEGEVTAVKGDKVQLCLHIPDDAAEHGQSWFEYAPISNNGMYAMPPVGTTVMLQWMGPEDGDCKAVQAVRDGTALPASTQRSLKTEHNKQMQMNPLQVSFFSDSNAVTLNNGIQIKTGQKLKLQAGGKLTLSSGRRVKMDTPEQIYLAKTGSASGIRMEGRRIHMKSTNTQFSSSGIGRPLPRPYREVIKPVTLQAGTVAALAGMSPQKTVV